MTKIYTITNEQLTDSMANVKYPGVSRPGQYTYSERANKFYPVSDCGSGSDTDSGLGIGGINRDQSAQFVPSARMVEHVERAKKSATVCRKCGASSLDGAMFTTLGGQKICDDCV